MPGSDTALTVDRTYSDPGRHHRCKSRVRAPSGRRGGASRWGGRGSSRRRRAAEPIAGLSQPVRLEETCGPGTRGHRWIGRLASLHCRPDSATVSPRQGAHAAGTRDTQGLAQGTATCGAQRGRCIPSPAAQSPVPCAPDALPKKEKKKKFQSPFRLVRSGVGSRAERVP